MTDERKNALENNSIYNTPLDDSQKLTQEEFDLGHHYCYDWDELFISPDDKEFECCTCHPLKQVVKYLDGEPCRHPGCLSHCSHPCEGCGRIGGRGKVNADDEIKL